MRSTDTGWQIDVPSGVHAQVRAMRDAFICRIAPAADLDVFQFGLGDATSALCNALYSPAQDLAYTFDAAGLRVQRGGRAAFQVDTRGPLTITVAERLLETRGGLAKRRFLASADLGPAPAGWASGPVFGADVTENDILATADWLARHLTPFGLAWLYVDDGWQAHTTLQRASNDVLQASTARFSNGMPALAAAIRRRGLRPALWATPFLQSLLAPGGGWSRLWLRTARAQPETGDAPVKDAYVTWQGNRVVDATFGDAGAHFRRFTRLVLDEWGFEGMTLGRLDVALDIYRRERAALHDPTLSPEDTLRRGLHMMRVTAGKSPMFHADAPVLPAAGLVQTIRSVPAAADGPAADAALERAFLNASVCHTEPGVLRVGPDVPLEQARRWVSFLGVSGQAVRLGDRMTDLPDERVELLRRILPVSDIHPMELYARPAGIRPRILALKVQHHGIGAWDVVALCNWEQTPAEIRLEPERLGLEAEQYICLDVWTGELVHLGPGLPTVTVPADACRVLSLWPAMDRPHFVGSSRHLTQGAVDVRSVVWEERRLTLRGESTLVAGDPYAVRVYVPPGYQLVAPAVTQRGPIAELRLDRPYGGHAAWWLRFERV